MMQIAPIFAIFFKKNQEYFDLLVAFAEKSIDSRIFLYYITFKIKAVASFEKMRTFEILCMNVHEQPAGWTEGVGKSAEERHFSVPTKRCDELTEETGAKKIALLITKV